MAERRTRRSFTREFKAQAVKRLLDDGKGLSEVATELGIGTGQLGRWRAEHRAAGSAEALAARGAEQAETRRLKREVKRVEAEAELRGHIGRIFAAGRRACGSPRVHAELRREGRRHSRRRVARPMRGMGFSA